jgi:hypothetical protein
LAPSAAIQAHAAWKAHQRIFGAEKNIDATRGVRLHGMVALHKTGVHTVNGQLEYIANTRAAQ